MKQRYDAVLAILRDGTKITEVAEIFGVHRDRNDRADVPDPGPLLKSVRSADDLTGGSEA